MRSRKERLVHGRETRQCAKGRRACIGYGSEVKEDISARIIGYDEAIVLLRLVKLDGALVERGHRPARRHERREPMSVEARGLVGRNHMRLDLLSIFCNG